MSKCCLKFCRSKFSENGEISFHRFPRDSNKKQQWVEAIRTYLKQPDWTPAPWHRICSLHFRLKDLEFLQKQRRILSNAIPYFTTEDLNYKVVVKPSLALYRLTSSKTIKDFLSQPEINKKDHNSQTAFKLKPMKNKENASLTKRLPLTELSQEEILPYSSMKFSFETPNKTCSSEDSLISHKKRIKTEHQYFATPDKLEKKYKANQYKLKNLKLKYHILFLKDKRKKEKIFNMMKEFKKISLLNEELSDKLKNVNESILELFKKKKEFIIKNKKNLLLHFIYLEQKHMIS